MKIPFHAGRGARRLPWVNAVLAAGCLMFGAAFGSRAQLPTATLDTIDPPVAQAGSTVEVNLTGDQLDDLTGLHFSDSRIHAEQVMLPDDGLLLHPRPNGNRFKVTVPEEVEPGIHEVRTVGHFGLSTSRAFVVAAPDAAEVMEEGDHARRESAMPLEINTTVTGTLTARQIDWYRFTAKAGQRLLVHCVAERIDSRMDGLLALYDSNGVELERNRAHFGRDPMLDFTAPADAEYSIAVSDVLYRGSREHFYRVTVSDRPHVDFVFPPAGMPGSKGTYTLHGRNLPGGQAAEGVEVDGKRLEAVKVEIAVPEEVGTPSGFQPAWPRRAIHPGFDFRFHDANPWRMGFATAPVVLEEANVSEQEVAVPCEIAGRFDQPNDEDAFSFQAKKGETWWIEIVCDRMSVDADPFVVVERVEASKEGEATWKVVAENDDMKSFFSTDNLDTYNADTVDAALSFTADKDGEYRVTVGDRFGEGGAAQIYRLALRQASPDFQVLAVTERPLPTNRTGYSVTPVLRRGGTRVVRLIVPRRDGFTGDIIVTAEGLPKGVAASPAVLAGDTDTGVLVLSAAADAPAWAGAIRIVGTAEISDAKVVREARFGTIVWGHVFADSIRVRSRLDVQMPLSVTDCEQAPMTLACAEDKTWKVAVGGKLEFPVVAKDTGARKGNLTVKVHGFPGMGRRPPQFNLAEKATEGKLTIDFKPSGNFKVKPGRFQFVLEGIGVARYRHNVQAVERAKEEIGHLTAEISRLTGEVGSAEQKVKEATETLDKTSANAASVSSEAQAGLEAGAAKPGAALDAARQELENLKGKLKRANQLKTETGKELANAEKAAKEKNLKFAVFSRPIMVEVLPKAE